MTYADFIRSLSDEGLAELITRALSVHDRESLKKLHNKGINMSLVEDLQGAYSFHLKWLTAEVGSVGECRPAEEGE